jgi:hypothetical protein
MMMAPSHPSACVQIYTFPSGCLQMDTLPSRELRKTYQILSGQRGITPAFGYGAPHPGARGTLTLLNNVLLSTHFALC